MTGPIPIKRVGSTLLATIQLELRDAVAGPFQQDVLSAIDRTGAEGLIIDISGLEIVDSYVARILARTARMAKLMGTETVLVGMRPEVAATLVNMEFRLDGVHTALNVDQGLRLLADRARDRHTRRLRDER